MSNDIKVTMTSDQRQLMADFIKQQEALQKTSQKFVELGVNAEKALRKAQNEVTTTKVSFTNILPSITNMAAGYLSATTAINTFITAQKQAQDEATATGKKFDDIFRKMQVQGGMTDLQRVENQARVLSVAEKVGVTSDFAGGAARQLISSDFSNEQSTGGSLRNVLEGMAAANVLDQDPTEVVKSVSQFIDAMGMKKDDASVKTVLRGLTNLQATGATELMDASQLASKVQGFRGLVSPEELLGTFEVMRQKTSGENASTALKIFGERLTTVTGSKERLASLKKLGLKPEDVDFKGENIREVLDRVSKGAEALPSTISKGVLADLFGTDALSSISGLLADRGKITGNIQTVQDENLYQRSIGIATSGRNAESRRQGVRQERLALMEDEGADIARRELDNQLRAQGFSPAGRAFVTAGFDTARTFGASVEDALTFSQPGQGVITGRIPGMREGGEIAVREAVLVTLRAINPEEYQRRIDAFNQQQLATMRSIDATLKRNPVAPPPKPPSAALGAKR